MIIVLGSIFRNSTSYISRYAEQARGLRNALRANGHHLELVLVEGDSLDGTYAALRSTLLGFDLHLIKREHGGPQWGSIDKEDRWRALSYCCNGVLENVPLNAGAVIYVESDLIWDTTTMLRLLNNLKEVPACATMCFTTSGHFYDIWGHMKDGENFTPFPPYHPSLEEGLTEVDSAGSCIAMRGEVARRARFGPYDCVRGLGRSIREHGFYLYVDPQLKVVHP